jgi:hypothetical protein
MMVLLVIQGKCAGFRAKNIQVSGHLPLFAYEARQRYNGYKRYK